jgi:MinD-like ATPase involved in chromosome partitioning or flagellar assembly
MAHVYTLANAKGGCGKSTVALNLAICFARNGHRTLAIDLEQQGNLSAALGVDLNELKFTAHWLLINDSADISTSYCQKSHPKLRPSSSLGFLAVLSGGKVVVDLYDYDSDLSLRVWRKAQARNTGAQVVAGRKENGVRPSPNHLTLSDRIMPPRGSNI